MSVLKCLLHFACVLESGGGDGGASVKKVRTTEVEMVGQHQERLVRETRDRGGCLMNKKHRPHIKVGKDAEEECSLH